MNDLQTIDYFAAKALQGLLSRDLKSAGEGNKDLNDHSKHAHIWEVQGNERGYARQAYVIAEQMMKIREGCIKKSEL